MISFNEIARFVADAIEGKYPDHDWTQVSRKVQMRASFLQGCKSFDELLKECRPLNSVDDDINNQVVALLAIDKFSHELQMAPRGLALLHRMIYASDSATLLRAGKQVPGFPGDLAISATETAARFDEVELTVYALTRVPVQSVEMAAPLLAHVFSSIIRIHRFEDGNGRVARLSVQYLLKLWGAPIIALPKVRNSTTWREALDRAIKGDIELLVKEIAHRMLESRS